MTLLSLILWWILGVCVRITARLPAVSRSAKTLGQFALNSPIHAILITIFAISLRVNVTEQVLRELGHFTILLYGRNSYEPPVVNRFSLLNIKRSILGAFWCTKILEVADYKATSGWQKRFFWQKILGNFRWD